MAAVSKLMSISFIIITIIAGIISFYMMSDLQKEQKKSQIEELTSQLINFVIFIWVGKLILNFSIFMNDPMAILAYPSDSSSFYLAVLFSGLFLFYKSKKGKIDALMFMASFIHVFLVASFLYEFIQFVWNNNPYSFGYMILLAILLVLFLFIHGVTINMLLTVVLIGWSLGLFVLTIVQPYVTVFGYIMQSWFVGVFFVIGFTIIIINQRKKVRNEWN
ncbi:hypothetical protein [Salipaludibacillus sp. CF4.18]|uniref:hypothetical protein n=1 Tax=Salipaludibacillus sp. CF4.18 TaxID=3373081 RepID=UPI003EE42845